MPIFPKFLRNSSVNDPEAKFFLCQKSIVVAKLTPTSISEQKKFYSDLVINTLTANVSYLRHFSQILTKTDVVCGNSICGRTKKIYGIPPNWVTAHNIVFW